MIFMKNMSYEDFDVYFEEVAVLSRVQQTALIAELADEIADNINVVRNLQNIQLIIDMIALDVDKTLINEASDKTFTTNPTFWNLPVN
jgi:hypothetical protein